MNLSHDEIGDLARRKLKAMGYIVSLSNITGAAISEKPDAIGFKSCGESFLVEVKVSRSDFFADKKKPHRNPNKKSLGNFRAYLAPAGLLSLSDIPYGWQLWEVHGKTRPVIKIIKGQIKRKTEASRWPETVFLNCDADEFMYFYDKSHYRGALGMLIALLSRADDEGVDIQKLATRNGKGFKK